MTQTRFTPGPWRKEQDERVIWGACDPDLPGTEGMGVPVANALPNGTRSWGILMSDEQIEANAHLIASAPELYDALEESRKTIVAHEKFLADEVFDPLFAQICAALAKARGEA